MSKKERDVKDEVLEKAFAEIEKKYGKNTVYFGGSNNTADVVVFKSGILTMDMASNIGGLPRGRLIEYYGIESSGKTTAALLNIVAAQKRGEKCAFIDVEQAIDPIWAKKLGVDWDNLIFAQPETAEKALFIVEELVRSGVVSLIVIDSIAALVLEKELEDDISDVGFPIKARMLSGAFRKLTSIMAASKYSTVICLNHKMEKIGQFGHGDKSTTPGGKALKFYSSMRVEFTRLSWINEKISDDEKKKVGSEIQIKFIKNKCATPYGTATYNFLFGVGVDLVQEIIDLAEKFNIISYEKKSKDYSYNGVVLASGLRRLKSYLKNETNAQTAKEIKEQIGIKMLEKMAAPISKEESDEIEAEEKKDAEELE